MACLIASLIRYAIQARMTTEDPADNFRPDTGRLQVWTLLIASLIRPTAGLAAGRGLLSASDCV
jgi:pyruvate carboxylase